MPATSSQCVDDTPARVETLRRYDDISHPGIMVGDPSASVKQDTHRTRAMQFSLFPWLHEAFGPFPPARGKAGMGGKRPRVLPTRFFTPTLPYLRGRENTDRRGRRKLNDPAPMPRRCGITVETFPDGDRR